MHLVVFGLTVSSSWANGHATIWRGLCRALGARGHCTTFFERDVPYYAAHRDLLDLPGGRLVLYETWDDVRHAARRALATADAAIVTSYCPDARDATALVLDAGRLAAFYDLDTPVTLARLEAGEEVPYLPADGLSAFDIVLSYTGGAALDLLRTRLGARRVTPLYGSVDPDVYRPGRPHAAYDAVLSYLGTFAADRQPALDALFLQSARQRPDWRFLIGGSQYPADFTWLPNVHYVPHVWPSDHPDFYASSRFTLNVTRGAMARLGYCPSGRLFEAAACEATLLSDRWDGIDTFFEPDGELILVDDADAVLAALELPEETRRRTGRAARERVLNSHTAAHRAEALERALDRARDRAASAPASHATGRQGSDGGADVSSIAGPPASRTEQQQTRQPHGAGAATSPGAQA
ncbi:MAG TPA: glycosyltransferase [Vicinamibacterales bacterium]